MRKLRKLWRLPFSHQWLLLITILLLVTVRVGLWLLPCRHWLRLSQRPVPLPPPTFFHLRQKPSFVEALRERY
jgi:hypothetical protein